MGGRGAGSLTAELKGSRGRNLGKTEKVSLSDLPYAEQEELRSEYNYKYAMGLLDNGVAYIYLANYQYRVRPYDIDDFMVVSRRRLL